MHIISLWNFISARRNLHCFCKIFHKLHTTSAILNRTSLHFSSTLALVNYGCFLRLYTNCTIKPTTNSYVVVINKNSSNCSIDLEKIYFGNKTEGKTNKYTSSVSHAILHFVVSFNIHFLHLYILPTLKVATFIIGE